MQTATVVGAGVFGAWIAHTLNERGWRVTLIDQHGPANARGSSGGETRITRSAYGSLGIYSRWAQESLPAWLALEDRTRQRLFVKTGALFLSRDRQWLTDTVASLDAVGISIEWIASEELRRRFRQFRSSDPGEALFEPNAGVLFARRAVQSLADVLAADGVRVLMAQVDAARLMEESDDDALIFATGAWLPAMFPGILDQAIVPTRQEVFFFGAPAGDPRFAPPHLPSWVAFDEGVYGVPDLEHRGVKIAFDAHGAPADPENMDRRVDAAAVARVREALQRHLPALAGAPLLESRVCQYENTADGHFLLDRLPGEDRIWIAGGGSGHGFKHGPAIGRYVADLIEQRREPEAIFQLARRPLRQRSVY